MIQICFLLGLPGVPQFLQLQGGGASITQILLNGDWTNLGTYQRFYHRTVDDTPVGRLILEEANVSFGFQKKFKYKN